MNKIYELGACQINIKLEPKLIKVYGDAELWRFLSVKADSRLIFLIQCIKNDYEIKFKMPFKVSDDSLITEIIIHVYCDYIVLRFNRFIKIKWIQQFVIKILKRAEIVDCGEKSIDSNRWLWDYLSKFKTTIIKILPKNLNAKCLK